ncbi:MAG: salicylate hydroxylase [Halieaceae bacterium]
MERGDGPIAVVGAGIAGLTLALALRKKGFEVDLYEAVAELRKVGAGITLAPNAMHGMQFVGVADAIADAGVEPVKQHVSHWQHGDTLNEFVRADSRERYGAAYVYIHRADLQDILFSAAHAAGVRVHLDKRLVAIDSESAEPRLEFADGSSATAGLVVGADGLKSVVRQLFRPTPAQFTGHIAFRALAPRVESIRHLIDNPGIHIGPMKMVVRYPLRKGELLNLVFFAREDGWTEDGWSITAKPEELRRLYGDWCEDIGLLIEAIQPGTLHKWAINAHSPLDSWSRNGRVILVGDAAHAMTPFLGQGAAMGIEDAVVLARALGSAPDQEQALALYQSARLERTHLVQRESNLNADRIQGGEAELYGLGKLTSEETLGLFDYDCGSVPL